LPESYLLYHGPLDDSALRPALEAWTWASGPVGEYYPLLLLGFETAGPERIPYAPLEGSEEAGKGGQEKRLAPGDASLTARRLLAEYGLERTVHILPSLAPQALERLYRGCSALFHPDEAEAWGDPARLALACGRPLVGLETPRLAVIAGPAAYLVPPGRPADAGRALGAALITVVVEESVAEALALQAQERASAWQPAAFTRALEGLYRTL
jgi:glycosyltransferase involved in cell wall biosynthesis